ncbi:MAG TPA: type II secretion system protein M [Steroidobacteraceae bacterium]|jgi:type II secretory pathway component PulM|nr:type II secretion system protein M [Steroidobacteraceae bacterium]
MKLSVDSFSFRSFSLRSLSPEALAALSPRERRLLLIGAVAAVLILIFGMLVPLDRSVAHAQERLTKKRADLTWMQSVAPQIALIPLPSSNGESLLVIIDRSARESGLASALSGSEPGSGGNLSVRLEKAPFDVLVGWLARLAQQNGVTVDSAIIEKSGTPGLVNANIVLHTG